MVDAVERPRDMVTGLAKGFAFITFKDPGIVDLIVSLNQFAHGRCQNYLTSISSDYDSGA